MADVSNIVQVIGREFAFRQTAADPSGTWYQIVRLKILDRNNGPYAGLVITIEKPVGTPFTAAEVKATIGALRQLAPGVPNLPPGV